MSVTDIIEKIKSDGNSVIRGIQEDTHKEIARIEKKAHKTEKDLKKAVEIETERLCKETHRRIAVAAEQKLKKAKDALKRKIIDEVFDKAASIDKTELEEYLRKILAEFGDKKISIRHGKEFSEILKKIASHNVKIHEDPQEMSVVVETSDGEYDIGYERAVRNAREHMEVEVAKIVFGKHE